MPTLHWIGKEKVVNHHREVPFRVLDHGYGYSAEQGRQQQATGSGNRIIHGDNLEALKALLPEYEGKVKCIYIDPPYNTGNEGWAYNDNVNDPKIRRWLHQVVGKEGEDLSRHDKWLCMMYPRLRLLHKLLANDGVIFLSIDDIEVNNLRLLLDELFGRDSLITQLVWKSRKSEDARTKTGVSNDHEYILCYSKTPTLKFSGVEKDLTKFSNPDNDPRGPWRSADLTGLATIEQRPNLHYELVDPATGTVYQCPPKGWRNDKTTMAKKIVEGRILFPKNSDGRPRQKMFVNEMGSTTKAFSSVIVDITTGDGTKEINSVLGSGRFDFPKPSKLIQRLLEQVTDEDSIVLDSFAGSGTTAHAVLNLNREDGGNRRFILVEMEEYAETITAERVKRVMQGYGEGKGAVDGTGGSFDYYTLGPALFDENGHLNEEAGLEQIRRYVWYSETRTAYSPPASAEEGCYLLGSLHDTAYFFVYEKDHLTTLDYDFLAGVRTRAGQYVIYADNCLLPKEFLAQHNIVFKKIPRDISRF